MEQARDACIDAANILDASRREPQSKIQSKHLVGSHQALAP